MGVVQVVHGAVWAEEAVAAYLSPSEPASSVRSLCSPDVAAAGSSTVVGSAATSQVQEAALTALLLHLHRGHVSFLDVLKCIERCSSAPGTTATDATAAAEAAAVATPKDCSAYVKAAHTRNAAATLPAQILQRMPELPLKASSSACTATKAATHSAPSSGGMGGSGGGRLAEEDALWQLLLLCSSKYFTDWQGTEGGAACCLAIARSSQELLLLQLPKISSSNGNNTLADSVRDFCTEDCTSALEREPLALDICRQLEGERDPRCLLLLFAIIKELGCTYGELLRENELEAVADLLMAYFPVSFTPPPNAAALVTEADLTAAFNDAAGATSRFGPPVLSLLADILPSLIEDCNNSSGSGSGGSKVMEQAELLPLESVDIWALVLRRAQQPAEDSKDEEPLSVQQAEELLLPLLLGTAQGSGCMQSAGATPRLRQELQECLQELLQLLLQLLLFRGAALASESPDALMLLLCLMGLVASAEVVGATGAAAAAYVLSILSGTTFLCSSTTLAEVLSSEPSAAASAATDRGIVEDAARKGVGGSPYACCVRSLQQILLTTGSLELQDEPEQQSQLLLRLVAEGVLSAVSRAAEGVQDCTRSENQHQAYPQLPIYACLPAEAAAEIAFGCSCVLIGRWNTTAVSAQQQKRLAIRLPELLLQQLCNTFCSAVGLLQQQRSLTSGGADAAGKVRLVASAVDALSSALCIYTTITQQQRQQPRDTPTPAACLLQLVGTNRLMAVLRALTEALHEEALLVLLPAALAAAPPRVSSTGGSLGSSGWDTCIEQQVLQKCVLFCCGALPPEQLQRVVHMLSAGAAAFAGAGGLPTAARSLVLQRDALAVLQLLVQRLRLESNNDRTLALLHDIAAELTRECCCSSRCRCCRSCEGSSLASPDARGVNAFAARAAGLLQGAALSGLWACRYNHSSTRGDEVAEGALESLLLQAFDPKPRGRRSSSDGNTASGSPRSSGCSCAAQWVAARAVGVLLPDVLLQCALAAQPPSSTRRWRDRNKSSSPQGSTNAWKPLFAAVPEGRPWGTSCDSVQQLQLQPLQQPFAEGQIHVKRAAAARFCLEVLHPRCTAAAAATVAAALAASALSAAAAEDEEKRLWEPPYGGIHVLYALASEQQPQAQTWQQQQHDIAAFLPLMSCLTAACASSISSTSGLEELIQAEPHVTSTGALGLLELVIGWGCCFFVQQQHLIHTFRRPLLRLLSLEALRWLALRCSQCDKLRQAVPQVMLLLQEALCDERVLVRVAAGTCQGSWATQRGAAGDKWSATAISTKSNSWDVTALYPGSLEIGLLNTSIKRKTPAKVGSAPIAVGISEGKEVREQHTAGTKKSLTPSSDSPFAAQDDSTSCNEAVLCAVNARPQPSGSGLRVGLAVFDPRRPSLHVVELSSDSHLTSIEAILMQVGAVSVLVPSGDTAPWQRRLPYVVHAVGAELLEAKRTLFSTATLNQDLAFLMPSAALKPAAARELRLETACSALAALISYWSPLVDADAIRKRHDIVEAFMQARKEKTQTSF
ncbi:DNA mismatch repair related protein [Cyclospora cayetanensis]|uniref:MMS19 nucleotide excision repair protein n=1 Tax=Cyclospora cayetanensis TaxID=88456 RepID=A0A1D3CYE1_9EIME|nr:DNA mismatch repair related protein [Cyclospora cayetanensis]